METEEVPFQLLREITNDFSEQRKIGEGAFGEVYKGVTKNGEDVAVKVLRNVKQDIGYKQFKNELYNLMKVKHNNVVQFIGYCYETEKTSEIHNGTTVPVEVTHRALCFEYLHNGSLRMYLSDESCGLDWHTRYKIIEGTCEGLKHIHEGLEKPLYHLDLKPDNILLDENMVPKIADFGLSRIFGDELTRTIQSPIGTLGFQPPEYIEKREVSEKFDVFSLGVVMIRIVSGQGGYSKYPTMSKEEFIDQVKKEWRDKLQKTCGTESMLEKCCDQVVKCTHIALKCIETNSQERPNIGEIIDTLNAIGTGDVEIPPKGCRGTFSGMTMDAEKRTELKERIDYHQDYLDVGEELVGRTEEKNRIMNLLMSITQKLAILPIYGIGGIGKTTFARMIYNDIKLKNYAQVWVDVSQRFDLNRIRNSIISQLHESENKANGRKMVSSCLTKARPVENILIVLDDLWEDNPVKLEELKDDILYHDGSNTIVIVTTRSKRVAEKICTNFMKPYKIEFLTDDMCWDIIKQRSGFEGNVDKDYLLDIGREIARKCGGVALAAKSLGFMLKSMASYQWKQANDNDIWNESVSQDSSMPNHVLQSLKLSYESMDQYLNLKKCFTYCGIFPKGHKIEKDVLIHQWISLGFIKPTKLMSTVEVSEKYVAQLVGLSFLEYSNLPQTYRPYGEHDTLFTMHDLVHDLAISILGGEILDQSKQGNTRGSACLYALLNDCTKPLELCSSSPERLRALRFLGCLGIELRGDALAAAESLQVLDLSDCLIQKLPDCIGELKQLRYLNAPMIQDTMVPECITKLSNLMYLNLSRSPTILALPESIGEMESLVYLDLSGCSGIGKLPESFGELKNLEYMDFTECSNVKGVSECLAKLTKLQYLNLSYCKHIGNIPSALGSLIELQYLNLSCSSYIQFEDGRDVVELLGCLTKLKYLNLSAAQLSFFSVLPEALGRLTELRYLNLSDHIMLTKMPRSFVNLRSLVHLDLSKCCHIKGVPEALSGLTKLQYLDLSECSDPKYTLQNSLQGLQDVLGNLKELRYLDLHCCLKSIFGDQAVYERDSFLGNICNLTNLEYLDLSHNDNLYSLPETICNLKKLHTLDLTLCTNLQRLPVSISEIDSLKFLYTLNCWKLDKSTYLSTRIIPSYYHILWSVPVMTNPVATFFNSRMKILLPWR
ncbi:hypothetical protein BS78_K259900 [Paspalum vaginatum]|uniref:Protein kinase domain-containing protein n=1 Tax=Paspalum vaginatum TaxID=158149 RepID=A0A9W7XE29_9POAL|nr:hypothetical protein BS78_K259900 [Paspalum vaginatum]